MSPARAPPPSADPTETSVSAVIAKATGQRCRVTIPRFALTPAERARLEAGGDIMALFSSRTGDMLWVFLVITVTFPYVMVSMVAG